MEVRCWRGVGACGCSGCARKEGSGVGWLCGVLAAHRRRRQCRGNLRWRRARERERGKVLMAVVAHDRTSRKEREVGEEKKGGELVAFLGGSCGWETREEEEKGGQVAAWSTRTGDDATGGEKEGDGRSVGNVGRKRSRLNKREGSGLGPRLGFIFLFLFFFCKLGPRLLGCWGS